MSLTASASVSVGEEEGLPLFSGHCQGKKRTEDDGSSHLPSALTTAPARRSGRSSALPYPPLGCRNSIMSLFVAGGRLFVVKMVAFSMWVFNIQIFNVVGFLMLKWSTFQLTKTCSKELAFHIGRRKFYIAWKGPAKWSQIAQTLPFRIEVNLSF